MDTDRLLGNLQYHFSQAFKVKIIYKYIHNNNWWKRYEFEAEWRGVDGRVWWEERDKRNVVIKIQSQEKMEKFFKHLKRWWVSLLLPGKARGPNSLLVSKLPGERCYLNKSYFFNIFISSESKRWSLKLITESELALFPSSSLAL